MMNQEPDIASGYGHERQVALVAAQAMVGVKEAYASAMESIRNANVSGTGRHAGYKEKVRKKNRKANKVAKQARRK